MSNRTVYHVIYSSSDKTWKVKKEKAERASVIADTKEEAIEAARDLAKANKPSQVIVHKLDGTIETEWTYGDDPERYPG